MESDGESRVTKSRSPSMTRLRSDGMRCSSSKNARNCRGTQRDAPASVVSRMTSGDAVARSGPWTCPEEIRAK